MRALLWLTLAALFACGQPSGGARSPEPKAEASLLPARVRRLTNVEYERTVTAVVGAPEHVADRLPPDVRQDGYTTNAEQAAPSSWAAAVDVVAREVAHRTVYGAAGEAVTRLEKLVPCAKAGAPPCANTLVETLARRAWRRPLEPAERATLLEAFADAAKRGGFSAGAETLLTALLESPSLLYVTELGPGAAPGAVVTLTPYEIASLLSYTMRGGPPDDALLEAAESGALLSPDERERQARRLLSLSDTRQQFRRFVLEWLEVDGLPRTTKSGELFPAYEAVKDHMLEETSAFVDEIMVHAGGSVHGLLDAGFASVDPPMARFYGLRTWGSRASLAGTRRTGVLQQASFLSAHAHEDGTSPVKRGDFVLRRLLCTRLPRPSEVGIDTVFPPPARAKTTRERFAAHSADPSCSACHREIDAFGFPFESFDAIGGARTTDNDRPVDTQTTIELDGQRVSFHDSFDVSERLARSAAVSDCYRRQAFRYFTGQSDARVEDELVGLAATVSSGPDSSLFDALLAFVRSDLFVRRQVHP